MAAERLILCGGAAAGRQSPRDPDPLRLRLAGPEANVHRRIEDVCRNLYTPLSPALHDLIDLAAYVYAADQAVPRGAPDDEGDDWRRSLTFRVPVREPDRWRSGPVADTLHSTLSFLSEDHYRFEFIPLTEPGPAQPPFDFGGTAFDGVVEDVALFSGGLDSLAGAVREAVGGCRKLLLVNHRSNDKGAPRHRALVARLNELAGRYAPLQVRVRVNKVADLSEEHTQRTRSFLYAALGATFAAMIGRDRLFMFENGVVGLNLPLSAQLVGARASRTTHPRVLRGFSALLSALTERPFTFENPFLWHTKTDVVRVIADAACGELIGLSTSCGRTRAQSHAHPHCGVCSQCVDRRFAVLAAGQEVHDPAGGYAVDLLTGARSDDWHRVLLTAYLETANQVEGLSQEAFFGRFGEAARVFRHVGLAAGVAARRVYELYQRHAAQVNRVVDRALADNATAIRRRTLDPTCLVRLVFGGEAARDAPQRRPLSPPSVANSFVRRGDYWQVRYDGGEEQIYPAEVGFDYLHHLLQNPGRAYTASALSAAVGPAAVANRRPTTREAPEGTHAEGNGFGGDELIDAEGRENLRRRVGEIEIELAAWQGVATPDRAEAVEALERERDQIAAELRRATGKGGRPRKTLDPANRVRNRVCNAIRRAVERIHALDPRLAAHLSRPSLHLGHSVQYAPPAETRWSTTAEPVSA